MSSEVWSAGSEWRRWDPHLHTPITALENRFSKPADWPGYLAAINAATPAASVLGITDYLSIDAYEKTLGFWKAGNLPNVSLLFPNVEMRLTVQTKLGRGINIHLLFSPDESEHITLIREKLCNLSFKGDGQPIPCSRDGLIRLGKSIDPRQQNEQTLYETGVDQFKVEFNDLRVWYEGDTWLKNNCLIALCAGTKDGDSGLQHDGGFKSVRREFLRFSHIIFSGNQGSRDFWIGNGSDSERTIVREYGSLKPCLHGSDAHDLESVLSPDGERRCWIKADPTFDGLRQTLLEPEGRVFIGPEPPTRGTSYHIIKACHVENAQWLQTTKMTLSPGLITVIGPRGSGKTALADLLAVGAHSYSSAGDASFLQKAKDLADDAYVTLSWGDGDDGGVRVGDGRVDTDGFETPRLRYLSQHFVEQLCNSSGLDDELVDEIEHVIFDAIDETDRLGTGSFRELVELKTRSLRDQREDLRAVIRTASTEIATEDRLKASLPQKQQALANLDKELEASKKQLAEIVTKGNEARQAEWQKLSTAVQSSEGVVTKLKLRRQALVSLKQDVARLQLKVDEDWRGVTVKLREAGVRDDEWQAFRMAFVGKPNEIIARETTARDGEIRKASDGPWVADAPYEKQTLAALKDALAKLTKELGEFAERQRRFATLKEAIDKKQLTRQRLDAEIKHIGKADERRASAVERRLVAYGKVFESLETEKEVLEGLYAHLRSRLDACDAAARPLEFFVHRTVDVTAWAEKGEVLIDLRRDGPFQGRGTIEQKAKALLEQQWREGVAGEAVAAMRKFLGETAAKVEDKSYFTSKGSLEDFASWMFSTEHIALSYGIRYEGVPIERLSPGTRGIVLLILYLAVDRRDERPLVIDQPEENLDPKSVFDVLVKFIRRARQHRQVIVVTHNPNLVVNSDADQVIVASAERTDPNALPRIGYEAGSLENLRIRRLVCDILEGGANAFQMREKRYEMQRMAAWWRATEDTGDNASAGAAAQV